MKKINNKGFLLVETLVSATFTLTVLVLLFVQFRTLITNYNNSYKYNTVEGIYNLNAVKKYLQQNSTNLSGNPYLLIYKKSDSTNCKTSYTNTNVCTKIATEGNFKIILYTDSLTTLKTKLDSNIPESLKEFIKKLDTAKGEKKLIAQYNDDTYAAISYDAGTSSSSSSSTPTVVEKTYTCPSGYTSSGSGASMTCSKTETISATQGEKTCYCSSGWELDGETCYYTIVKSQKARCAYQIYAKYTSSGSTTWVYERVPCDELSSYLSQCETLGKSRGWSSCYAGPALDSCPVKYISYVDYGCAILDYETTSATCISGSYSCPSGYTLSGSTCYKTTTTSPIES